MVTIKKTVVIPAEYSLKNGLIILEATGGKKPYQYSIDGGLTFHTQKEFPVFGGTYEAVVKDSAGDCSSIENVKVEKVLSKIQAEYLNNLFDCFGNESQAAMQTPVDWDENGEPIAFLPPRTVHNWRKDPDFAVFVRELKIDGNDYFKDYLEAKAIAIINGGIPIYQYISDPNPPTDDEGNIQDYTRRIKVQIGETLPDANMIKFMLERRYKDTYSTRQEITGKDGGERIIAISIDEEFSMNEEQ